VANEKRSAKDFLPGRLNHKALVEASQKCRGCDLYKRATQAVMGEGAGTAKVVLVGEQPGNLEDQQGHPFVGPAGKLLKQAMEEAGLKAVYLTNAVKHFKWEERGKYRIHKRPSTSEVNACRPWLEAEIKLAKPLIVVCLGATAARSVFGKIIKIGEARGRFQPSDFCENTFVTVHPSAILRSIDRETLHAEREKFVQELRLVAKKLKNLERK
jgi:uracil-DNA glycosylase family protein